MKKGFRLNPDDFARSGSFDGRAFIDDPSLKSYFEERRRGERIENDGKEGRLFVKYLPWMLLAGFLGVLAGFYIGVSANYSWEKPKVSMVALGVFITIFVWALCKKGPKICKLVYWSIRSST